MANVKCVHCGKMVFEMAPECSFCGKPVANRDAPVNIPLMPGKRRRNMGKNPNQVIVVFSSAVFVIIAIAGFSFLISRFL